MFFVWGFFPFMSFICVLKAPNNMKAVLQAGWLLTVAVGNFIVLIVAEVAQIPEKVIKRNIKSISHNFTHREQKPTKYLL